MDYSHRSKRRVLRLNLKSEKSRIKAGFRGPEWKERAWERFLHSLDYPAPSWVVISFLHDARPLPLHISQSFILGGWWMILCWWNTWALEVYQSVNKMTVRLFYLIFVALYRALAITYKARVFDKKIPSPLNTKCTNQRQILKVQSNWHFSRFRTSEYHYRPRERLLHNFEYLEPL